MSGSFCFGVTAKGRDFNVGPLLSLGGAEMALNLKEGSSWHLPIFGVLGLCRPSPARKSGWVVVAGHDFRWQVAGGSAWGPYDLGAKAKVI